MLQKHLIALAISAVLVGGTALTSTVWANDHDSHDHHAKGHEHATAHDADHGHAAGHDHDADHKGDHGHGHDHDGHEHGEHGHSH